MERQVKMHIDAKGTARVCKASSMKNWDTTGKHEAECEAWLPLSKAPSPAQPAGLPRGTGGQAAQAWPLRDLKWGRAQGVGEQGPRAPPPLDTGAASRRQAVPPALREALLPHPGSVASPPGTLLPHEAPERCPRQPPPRRGHTRCGGWQSDPPSHTAGPLPLPRGFVFPGKSRAAVSAQPADGRVAALNRSPGLLGPPPSARPQASLTPIGASGVRVQLPARGESATSPVRLGRAAGLCVTRDHVARAGPVAQASRRPAGISGPPATLAGPHLLKGPGV